MEIALELERHQTPDPEWAEALHRLAPRSDTVNWLHLAWMAGEPWQPVERWVIWEMMPQRRMREDADTLRALGGEGFLLPALEGPSPAEMRRPQVMRHLNRNGVEEEVEGLASDSLVSLQQWQLYRELGAFAQPVWVVQGSRGGHKRRLSETESQFLAMAGRPHRVPAPGDLPYADPDQRTWEALAEMDRLRRWNQSLSFARRVMKHVWAERKAEEVAFRQQLLDWLDRQIEDAVREVLPSHGPRGSAPTHAAFAEAEQDFLDNTATAVPD